jgi:hypothetical protein
MEQAGARACDRTYRLKFEAKCGHSVLIVEDQPLPGFRQWFVNRRAKGKTHRQRELNGYGRQVRLQ